MYRFNGYQKFGAVLFALGILAMIWLSNGGAETFSQKQTNELQNLIENF